MMMLQRVGEPQVSPDGRWVAFRAIKVDRLPPDVSEAFQLFTTLQRLGVPSKMLYFPDEGHWVLKPQNSQLCYKTVNQWVDTWVKK
ncbi:MAG TPA: prolyl oligopeptidase family serine peptidase [Terriglobales bacterium]|nr:prolyl oligopeptidase family serine peptidase [Terriglobales bacterium]